MGILCTQCRKSFLSTFDSSSPVKSHLDEVLGLIEVPVSGRVSFVTYQENPLNRVGHPEIVAVSNLCSIDIENAFEEVIQGDILNVDKFYFSMIKKLEV